MLSSSDCNDFMPTFEAFKVIDRIRHGIFDKLSEDLLFKQYGDPHKATSSFLAKGKSTEHSVESRSKLVLIVDEVDVFCSQAFFRGTYCPTLALKNKK